MPRRMPVTMDGEAAAAAVAVPSHAGHLVIHSPVSPARPAPASTCRGRPTH